VKSKPPTPSLLSVTILRINSTAQVILHLCVLNLSISNIALVRISHASSIPIAIAGREHHTHLQSHCNSRKKALHQLHERISSLSIINTNFFENSTFLILEHISRPQDHHNNEDFPHQPDERASLFPRINTGPSGLSSWLSAS